MDGHRKGWMECLSPWRYGGFKLIDLGSDRRRVSTGTGKEGLVALSQPRGTFDPTKIDLLGLLAK